MDEEISSPAKRLRIYIGETSSWHGTALYHAIVLETRKFGLAGATVFRCIEGFGPSGNIKTIRLLDLSFDLPIVIDIVDKADHLEAFIPRVKEMIKEGLITLENVEVIKCPRKLSQGS